MAVVGRNSQIISATNRTLEVRPFSSDHDSTYQVPIVYAAIRYKDEFTRENCMLIARDAFSTPAMDHKLFPQFAMREAGINVRTAPKFQAEDSSIDDNPVHFPKTNLRTPIKLCDVFSYFPSTKPSISMLNEVTKHYF